MSGFNVPSLLKRRHRRAYLHNGAAETLEDLLDPNGSFKGHLRAGNSAFAPSAPDVRNLIAFLQTIDDTTPTIALPAEQDFCPNGVVDN